MIYIPCLLAIRFDVIEGVRHPAEVVIVSISAQEDVVIVALRGTTYWTPKLKADVCSVYNICLQSVSCSHAIYLSYSEPITID